MTPSTLTRHAAMAALALAWIAAAGPLAAQQQPTASAIATAKELLTLKGALTMFDPLIPGIVESTKNTFLPTNPGLFKELNEVAVKVRTDLVPRRNEIADEIAKVYAQRFTEAEMKEVIAFYKTPAGKKFITEEPAAIDQGLRMAEEWSKRMSDEVMTRFRAEMKKKGHEL